MVVTPLRIALLGLLVSCTEAADGGSEAAAASANGASDCGNGVCDAAETCSSCPIDCGSCSSSASGIGGSAGGGAGGSGASGGVPGAGGSGEAGGSTGGAGGTGDEVLLSIPFQAQSNGTYVLSYGNGLATAYEMPLVDDGATEGPKNGVNCNQVTHVGDGSGYNGRNYLRYTRWADVEGADNCGYVFHDASPHPYATMFGDGTQHQVLRFRMRTVSPMIRPSGSSQMKWMIIGGPGLDDGCDRMIFSLYAGAGGHWQVPGGNDLEDTYLEINHGVCGGENAVARALISNGPWHHVQIAWRWGAAGTAYQRIYIDNNDIGSPTAENLEFVGGSWDFPVYRDYGGFGDIVSSNSLTEADAVFDFMDVEIAVAPTADGAFNGSWAPD